MSAEATGSSGTILVCIRGNSGSGKSSIARELGILYTGRYRDVLTALRDGHRGRSLF